jgi:hypothetical protein
MDTQNQRQKTNKMSTTDTKSELPAYRVYLANGTNYVTSMARNITLDKARAYFVGESIETTVDGGPETFSRCVKVEDVDKPTTTASATPDKVREEMTLSTGHTVVHERMKNGAQSATVKGSATGEMTEAEWTEYCAAIVAKRTIPAEKPTAIKTEQPYDWRTFDKIEQLKLDLRTAKRDLKYWMREALEQTAKCDKLEAEFHAHAEALAEALRSLRDFVVEIIEENAEPNLEQCVDARETANQALANWEGARQ